MILNSEGNFCTIRKDTVCKFFDELAKSNNLVIDISGSILNFITTILMIFGLILYRIRTINIGQSFSNSSPVSYSIMVENIPKDAKEDEIREFFSEC